MELKGAEVKYKYLKEQVTKMWKLSKQHRNTFFFYQNYWPESPKNQDSNWLVKHLDLRNLI